MIHKRLFFISKELQLNTKNYIQRSHSKYLGDERHKHFSTPHKENKPTGKKKRKERARSLIDKALKKSHNTNMKFHYREVTITSENYKIFLYISKITVSQTVLHISQHPVKAKTTRKGKRKRRREGERKRRRKRKKRRRKKK